ncbi:unnamed protein product [Mycena citricolor]|uniref:2-(3-amino-3-carboxypropyl)histidine synthase subunit 2 n=1 Tax=Mycena citricolor TaxID=2018698 RepID=A0AAD2HRD2_9AGAR|nr:unnamed protein product [Mycena citricolor]
MAAFSSSDTDVISRPLPLAPGAPVTFFTPPELDEYYDIPRTIEEISRAEYKRIALQFPDDLLHDSVPVYRRLKGALGGMGREFYVLADTSYGSCCVDEVAAQHVDAEAVVHYGRACMSKTSRLPVIYVFGKQGINIDHCVSALSKVLELDGASVELMFEGAYSHRMGDLISLTLISPDLVGIASLRDALHSKLQVPIAMKSITHSFEPGSTTSIETKGPRSSDHSSIVYIGGEGLRLANILITHSGVNVYSYDPINNTARLESSITNRLLMRRYAIVQKARDCDVFGILVGTLGVASYLPLIKHLRGLISRANKKSYTLCVGKLNPAKLANFIEVECFVLVACPENSLIDNKEFLRPVVTPFELETALQAEHSWSGRYVLDFGSLLSEANVTSPSEEDKSETEDVNSERPTFSLVSGKYRTVKQFGLNKHDTKTNNRGLSESLDALTIRNPDSAVALAENFGAQALQERSFQGLNMRLGKDAPSVLEQGRSGIAKGYTDDRSA